MWFRVFGFKYFKAATYKYKMNISYRNNEANTIKFGICDDKLYNKYNKSKSLLRDDEQKKEKYMGIYNKFVKGI